MPLLYLESMDMCVCVCRRGATNDGEEEEDIVRSSSPME